MTLARFFRTNMLYCGDNLEWLGNHIPDESIDLIYLDPPFFSNRNYEVIWGDEAEVRSFEDRWDAGLDGYVNWMEKRATELYRVLRPGGSFYLHCDWHAGHYLKVMLDGDALFGRNGAFRNEIIWKRTSGHSDAGRYGNVHDTILYYVKEGAWPTWNNVYQPYDESYVRQYYRYQDPDGRRWMSGDLSAAGLAGGGYEYEWKGVTRVWRVPRSTMERLDQEGRVYYTRNGIARMKRYLDESKGLPAQDVWTDLEALRSWHQERLGYPTQKPESLLARIIAASSNADDVVLDPFCGCGTTVAVAHMMKRQWIGMDISPTAVNLMKLRLQKLGMNVDPIGLPQTVADLKKLKPFEFQNWVIQQFYGTHSKRKSKDMGIDGYSFLVGDPIQVKRSERVGRPVVDGFETAVERVNKDKGYIVAFSFTSDAKKEAARVKRVKGLEIKLVEVEKILDREKLEAVVMPLPGRPIPGQADPEAPLPESAPKEIRPSGDELVESDQEAGEVA